MNGRESTARAAGFAEPGEHRATLAEENLPPFAAIYERYFDFVWSSARRFGVSPAAMDDVVQEIFFVIHAKLSTLKKPESLRSWIYGIVRRTASDHHRARRTREASGATMAIEADQPIVRTPADLAEQSDQLRLLFELMEELDWPKREVFMLAELEEMSAPEIASALDIPLNTAYSRLRAARLAFEQGLARHKARQERRG